MDFKPEGIGTLFSYAEASRDFNRPKPKTEEARYEYKQVSEVGQGGWRMRGEAARQGFILQIESQGREKKTKDER